MVATYLLRSLLVLLVCIGLPSSSCSLLPSEISDDVLQEVQDTVDAMRRRLQIIPEGSTGSIPIDVVVWIFEANTTAEMPIPDPIFISDDQLAQQMTVLNEGFANTPFTFSVRDTFRIVDDLYYAEIPPEFAFFYPRRGDFTTLNIYIGGVFTGESFAFLPYPPNIAGITKDGVYLDPSTVPGVIQDPAFPYGEGKTLVKATGYWFGLLDTYRGDSCDPNNQNDFIADTPQQASGTGATCPDSADTCPDLEGNDPVNNFMDNSTDACRTTFTQDQIDRMYYVYQIYRDPGGETCPSGFHLFSIFYLTDFFPEDINWSLESEDKEISWCTDFECSGQSGFQVGRGTHTFDFCIPTAKTYNFTVTDSRGNGIFVQGEMTLSLDGSLFKTVGQFSDFDTTIFQAPLPPSPPPTPTPTFEPLPPSPGFPPCSICGVNNPVLNPGLVLELPAIGNLTCEETFRAGQEGFVEAVFCPFIQQQSADCCVEAPSDPPTQAPTQAPTPLPTSPPTPSPTVSPTPSPTDPPTPLPTNPPTPLPTNPPSPLPTNPPTPLPPIFVATPPPTLPPPISVGPPTPLPPVAIATPPPNTQPTFAPTFPPFVFIGQPISIDFGGKGGMGMRGVGRKMGKRGMMTKSVGWGTTYDFDDDYFSRRNLGRGLPRLRGN